jgi:2-dehydro-3-deoxyphosphogluconate aldolase/(4S)-4-hydroxy-2-oxoglutarate aldolase
MQREEVLTRLSDCGVVAVIRAPSADVLVDIAKALHEGGVIGIEVTMSTPQAISAIEKVVHTCGRDVIVGVGTVLDAATCADAIHAGAEFVVSPVLDPAIVETTRRLGKVSVPGALTPTEIFTAWSAGADVVKIFPATSMGPQYIKDLLAPMPFLRLTPTGGVSAKNAADWIRAGAVMVGAGSTLVTKEAMAAGDWAAITRNSRDFVAAVKSARA